MCSLARLSVAVPRQEGRTLPVETQTSSETAQGADGRNPRLAGTQVRWAAVGLSRGKTAVESIVLEVGSGQTKAPSEVMIEGVRRRLRAAVAVKACHPLQEGEVLVRVVEAAEVPGGVEAVVVVDAAEIRRRTKGRLQWRKKIMVTGNKKRGISLLKHCTSLLISILFIALTSGQSPAAGPEQKTFASPEEAVNALVDVLKVGDTKALTAIFGSEGEDLVFSGDPVADKAEHDRFVSEYEEKNRLEEARADEVVLYVGNDDWPFPIPIVKEQGMWRFDTHEGREELLARRIGRNELSVIQVCLAYVDAQREYALKDRDGDGLLAYAQKFLSDPGKKNGLYWEARQGDEQSPLGPLAAAAQKQGYTGNKPAGEPVPYHGYYYRILKAQGKDAPGGAYDYVAKGQMIGGFALVAYPALYGSSGIMTFIVNHDGVVYQKDLGPNTEKVAQAMKVFDSGKTWKKIEEAVARVRQ
jgi:hypothetical protein